MENDIYHALEFWRLTNDNPTKWASFDCFYDEDYRVVRVYWGHIWDGKKEIPLGIRHFHLRNDGSWYFYDSYGV